MKGSDTMSQVDKKALKAQILTAVDEKQDQLLKLCSDLIKINTENPPGNATEIATYITDYLHSFDLDVTEYKAADDWTNLISAYGDPEGKKLIYCGHTDVVPAGDLNKWDFSPTSGEIKDGFLLGRGASDMKAGVGGILFAVTLLKDLKIELPGQVVLALVPDEETGSKYGVPWLLDNHYIKGDGCLIAEPSSEYNPTIGQKGSYWFTLEVFGQPGHGSLSPIIGGNAIVDTIKAIEKIRGLFNMEIELPAQARELVEISKKYMHEVETEKDGFQAILDHISCNIGNISGGTSANVVPESCKVNIDCRLPFGITDEEVTEYITTELDKLAIDYKMTRFGIKSVANYSSKDEDVCRAIVDNIAEISGHEAYGVMQWASSDARHFRDHDIPVLQYGPAMLSTIHGYNERVEVEKIILAAKVYACSIIDFLF